MSKHKVLILGGGFGGVKAALELSNDPRFSVTLVSDEDYFRYYPALYHSATGGARRVSAIPLSELLAKHPINFVKARATGLDREHKAVLTKGAGKLSYDSLVVALGMTTNYFGIKGLEKFSYGIKSIDEVERFKLHLHKQLTDTKRPDLHYLIVGAGPTGVELAGMLPGYLRKIMAHHNINHKKLQIELIEAAPRILPRLPKDIAKHTAKQLRKLGVVIHTNQVVQAETTDALMINGQPVVSHSVIWTAGVACSPFLQENKFTLTEHHKAQVDDYLQAGSDIYVIGDNADTKYGGVAQTALHDAIFVAHNLKRQADGKAPKLYKPKLPIYVTPTGPHWASVVWGRLHLFGRLGWMLREASDLVAYHDYQAWWPASQRWLALNDQEESCPTCDLSAKN
jgi:NADH dehydrogenase